MFCSWQASETNTLLSVCLLRGLLQRSVACVLCGPRSRGHGCGLTSSIVRRSAGTACCDRSWEVLWGRAPVSTARRGCHFQSMPRLGCSLRIPMMSRASRVCLLPYGTAKGRLLLCFRSPFRQNHALCSKGSHWRGITPSALLRCR